MAPEPLMLNPSCCFVLVQRLLAAVTRLEGLLGVEISGRALSGDTRASVFCVSLLFGFFCRSSDLVVSCTCRVTCRQLKFMEYCIFSNHLTCLFGGDVVKGVLNTWVENPNLKWRSGFYHVHLSINVPALMGNGWIPWKKKGLPAEELKWNNH